MKKKNFLNPKSLPLKAIISVFLLLSLCAAIYFSAGQDGRAVRDLPKYQTRIYAENGGILNGKMKYAEYTYEKIFPDDIEESGHLTVVDYQALETVKACISDYEKRIGEYLKNGSSKNREFALKYGFSPSQLTENDYCSVTVKESEDGKTVEEFSIYYFDLSEKKLYHFYSENEFEKITDDEA